MPTEILTKPDTPIVWADETDYGTGNQIGGTRTHDLDLTDLLFTAARQGVQADLGATRAARYAATISVEFKTGEAPESGETVDVYWGPSVHSAAASGNPGGLVGTDAAYTGTAGDSLADSLKQLTFIGSLVCTSDAVGVTQTQTFVFSPSERYGQPVVHNNTDAEDFNDVDATEMYFRMIPLIDEAQ